jgi:lipopolysaccharide transport system permease protein
MFAELLRYRELLASMTRRDLLLRYKQTIMGFGWAILMPVTYMLVFSVIFTRVVKLETGVPYPIYAYAGLLPWNFFASSLRFAVSSLTANPTLVTKVYFPREILPFSVILVSLVDFAVGAVVLVGLMIYYHVGIHPAVLFLPVVLVVQIMFTGGVTLILAMGNLFYRDVKYLIEILITLWMFATSVVYPVSKIGGWTGAALKLNPMTTIIDAYRSVLLHGQLPAPGPFVAAALVSAALLLLSWLAFHRAEYRFAESI